MQGLCNGVRLCVWGGNAGGSTICFELHLYYDVILLFTLAPSCSSGRAERPRPLNLAGGGLLASVAMTTPLEHEQAAKNIYEDALRHKEGGDDFTARRLVKLSLAQHPIEEAKVLELWLTKFGDGTMYDEAAKRIRSQLFASRPSRQLDPSALRSPPP